MKTLFAKTLLWFLGTALLTMTALILAAILVFDEEEHRPPPFAMLLQLQLSEARHAYESGGPEKLRETLQRFERVTRSEALFTDAHGRDLATGANRADLVREAGVSRRFPLMRSDRAFVARRSFDGRYWYFLMVGPGNWVAWFLRPQLHLSVLAVLLLLCYAFARHLTNPVKQLQRAVRRFGEGDLAARVNSRRRDELGKLARTFDQMADRIEMLVAAERRLLVDVSHELRSPLTRVGVALELARTSREEREKHLDRIARELDRLSALIGELLEVTRVEMDPSRLRLQTINPGALARQVGEEARIEAEARNCRIAYSSANPARIQGDFELLRRALDNIVRNAIRFAPEGSAVEISARGNRIAVRDYGPGVPAESLERIFHPFYRVDSDRNRASGGTGLGLAIAKRAVELHNGHIQAKNVSPGLEVIITLPPQTPSPDQKGLEELS